MSSLYYISHPPIGLQLPSATSLTFDLVKNIWVFPDIAVLKTIVSDKPRYSEWMDIPVHVIQSKKTQSLPSHIHDYPIHVCLRIFAL